MFNKILSIASFVASAIASGIVGICLFNLDFSKQYVWVVVTVLAVNAILAGLGMFLGIRYYEDWKQGKQRDALRKKLGRIA